jgi:hypothetical protein
MPIFSSLVKFIYPDSVIQVKLAMVQYRPHTKMMAPCWCFVFPKMKYTFKHADGTSHSADARRRRRPPAMRQKLGSVVVEVR